MKSDYKEYLDFAKDLALKSGEILLRFRGKAQITTTKSSQFSVLKSTSQGQTF